MDGDELTSISHGLSLEGALETRTTQTDVYVD